MRGLCLQGLRLLRLGHFLACSPEIAFNLHKLWGVFLFFLQFLLLKFKLNEIQKQENYLHTERLSKTSLHFSKSLPPSISRGKKFSPGLHLTCVYVRTYTGPGVVLRRSNSPLVGTTSNTRDDENPKSKLRNQDPETNAQWALHAASVKLNFTQLLVFPTLCCEFRDIPVWALPPESLLSPQ